MTNKTTINTRSIKKEAVVKAALIGAGLGFLIILLFITGTDTQSQWPDLWKVRPLIITPLAGALGGSVAYIAMSLLKREGLNRLLAVFLGVIGFAIALWLGVVLGLDGTLWD